MKPRPGMQDPRDTRDPSTLRTQEPPEFSKDPGPPGSSRHPGPLCNYNVKIFMAVLSMGEKQESH